MKNTHGSTATEQPGIETLRNKLLYSSIVEGRAIYLPRAVALNETCTQSVEAGQNRESAARPFRPLLTFRMLAQREANLQQSYVNGPDSSRFAERPKRGHNTPDTPNRANTIHTQRTSMRRLVRSELTLVVRLAVSSSPD